MTISRIILADDHGFIRMGLMQILRDEYPNATIKEVGDGESLIKEVLLHDWDLVISDIDMPGRSGVDALEQIKLLRPNLPVLILSIYTEELYAVRVLRAGASGFLNKNSAPAELIAAIHRIALGKKYITSEIAEQLLTSFDDVKKPHELLTNREFEIFKMLAAGKSNTEIGKALLIATSTISTYRSRIMEKMHFSSNANLTRYAIANHIMSDI